jgi:hypothetical protein
MRSAACVAVACALVVPSQDREPTVRDVVKRLAVYVDTYGQQASAIVATERYSQRYTTSAAATTSEHRETVADFAIVRAEAQHTWLGFRDVIIVDGSRVSDREDRLVSVLEASRGNFDEARRLSDESARFNIGPVGRNFNVPTTALFFFSGENIDRFSFKRSAVAGDGSWEVEFKETHRPTLIRTPDGMSIPSSGVILVNPANGVVRRTLLRLRFTTREAPQETTGVEIETLYHYVDAVGLWAPARMDELCEARGNFRWRRITGQATYSDYRRFQTSARIK